MVTMQFSTQINARPERVWQILWNDATYREWTSVFHEGSHAESDWQEGSKILFLGPDGGGMTSRIVRIIPNEFISFQHLGIVNKGVEDFTTAQAKGWAGARENYSLREKDGGTELHIEMDGEDGYEEYFLDTFPKALARVKELTEAQKITSFLWFDHEAEEAVNLYTSLFPDSKILNVVRNGDAVFTVDFLLGGQRFAALNGGPQFRFNLSISFFVACETEAEVDAAWQALSDGGEVLMPLNKYDWSEKYGWVQDRYGLSWQIYLGNMSEAGQKFAPTLMFTGAQHGRAEEALNFYTSIFPNSSINGVLKYGPGGADPEDTVKHAEFNLDGCLFMAMDSYGEYAAQFNEALSFVISCYTQDEIDYYWNRLSADGGREDQCGWLKDKFGVSWQVVPPILIRYLKDPDPVKAGNVMQAMLKMKKIDIALLQEAYLQPASQTVITVEATVNAPVEKVWTFWTAPEHITQWNHASDDWHSPSASNDLRAGGAFNYQMAARDGSASFDFAGQYDEVTPHEKIAYTLGDGRVVTIRFSANGPATKVVESFEAENTNSIEMQQTGWQAILDNFKKYVEGN
jgi:predicted 3-demethylubiquinone-9 3-methyltransferase (glyoxalase superfamily)/uncharacterized protein YndB with AHSA1/START domain